MENLGQELKKTRAHCVRQNTHALIQKRYEIRAPPVGSGSGDKQFT